LWKKVWGLAVQPKVRNFLWRAINNSIPSKSNLKWRQVILEDIYDHFKTSSKDGLHALWLCPHFSPIWNSDPSWNFRSHMVFHDFKELFQYVIKEGKNLEYFATIIWMVWFRRNALRTGSKPFPIHQVIPDVRAVQAEYKRATPPKLLDITNWVP